MKENDKGTNPENSGAAPDPFIAGLIHHAKVGEPIAYEGLSIFPLFIPDGHEPVYELLEDALEKKKAVITEASEGGSVPELLIENRGDKPVLILEGDVLIGAKQNRVVNITVLVPALAKFALPVSCVERGRWRYASQHFSIKRSANPDLRRAKVKSVLRSKKTSGQPMSDQMEVWDKVDQCLHSLAAESPTDSLEDGYAASEKRLEDYRARMRLPEGATGFLVATGKKIIGMDLFGEARTAARCWGRLSESYFIEALGAKSEEKRVDGRGANAFLQRVSHGACLCEGAIGLGREIEVEGPKLTGMGLVHEGRLVHLAAFALE